ncbi:unnamed protein product [Protopolystoma xenopodis]|uniref:Inosine triphosphate pyrophosphatase n=1 Tax=Protopolystoma xenopodis TaxID=117903 RepID=A0A448WAU0_9PLAT|nr:unnamed protein product [Protopolystoma xenopodis]
MCSTILFVSGNKNKLSEIIEILGDKYSSLLSFSDIDLPELQGTVNEVSIKKCEEAANRLNSSVLVEDTSLCFDALNGMPGPYIKWFLKALGPDGSLPKLITGFGENNSAEAICTFAYSAGPGCPVKLFQGVTKGRIVSPRGPRTFGWDPCFQPDEYDQTYAEMSACTKNAISHRSRAISQLKKFLDSLD